MNDKEKAIRWLGNTLNSSAQNGISKIRKKDLKQHLNFGYSSTDSQQLINVELTWKEISDALSSLEKTGVLLLLKDPCKASDDDICVKLKAFLSGTPFPDGWIRD